MMGGTRSSHGGDTNQHLGWGDMGWVGGRLCYSVMMVVGGNPSSPRWGVPYPVMMEGTPSSHGGGTNPHLGWGDTIPGMGWVRVSHPSSWLSTLARGYLPLNQKLENLTEKFEKYSCPCMSQKKLFSQFLHGLSTSQGMLFTPDPLLSYVPRRS